MWPTAVLGNGHTCDALVRRIACLKAKGIKIAATCHNLVPHYDPNPEHIRCYATVYAECDEIYHLGTYSFALFEERYPGKNRLLPHQVYTERYRLFPGKEESRRFLRLRSGRTYVLCFGAVRSREERQLIRYCADSLRKRAYFMVPSYLPLRLAGARNRVIRLIKRSLALLFMLRERLLHPNILFSLQNKVPEQDIPYWFSACDIGFIHRRRILNSGNVPLNYYYGNVVAGPDVGNVGVILKESGNPVFSADDCDTAVAAILAALRMAAGGLGERNRAFALANWREDMIAARQAEYYKELCQKSGKTEADGTMTDGMTRSCRRGGVKQHSILRLGARFFDARRAA